MVIDKYAKLPELRLPYDHFSNHESINSTLVMIHYTDSYGRKLLTNISEMVIDKYGKLPELRLPYDHFSNHESINSTSVMIHYTDSYSRKLLTRCSNSNALIRTAVKLAILSVCKSFMPCLNSRTLARFACDKEQQLTITISLRFTT